MKLKITLFLLAFSFACFAQDSEVKPGLPSVVVKNIEGEDVNIQSYASDGKITIVSFFATWCKPCFKEFKNYNDLLDSWGEEYNAELVGVSTDDSRNMSKVRPIVNGMGWDFDILLDPNGDIQRAMNVVNPPVTFLLDKEGKIVYTHTGYVEGDEYALEDEIKKLVE
mgnify:CR=1 FL=1|jgi:cytochrome c biogenesis protein CcmG/thiol:disulfide interchange protein DsbE